MEVRLGESRRRAGALGSPRPAPGYKERAVLCGFLDQSFSRFGSLHSVALGSRRPLLRDTARFCSAIYSNSGLILALPEAPPSASRSRPASRPPCASSTLAALEVKSKRCAPVPCRDHLGRPGSDSTLSQQGAQPHALDACSGARRHWP